MEVLRVLRNIFLRTFLVGAGIGGLMAIATILFWDAGMSFTTRFFHVDVATASPIVLHFFGELRFFLWFCLFTPGLALHWTLKAEEKKTRRRD